MADPSDPCVPSFGYLELGYDETDSLVVAHDGRNHRAAIMRSFAREQDVAFGEVACVVRYARSYTRQEVWDEEGKDRWVDEQNMEAKVGWYFAQSGKPAGWYSDLDGGRTPAKGMKLSDAPDEPPSTWEPNEYDQTFEFVSDPNASYPTPVHRVFYLDTH